jgi:hypothetical protein
MKRTVLAILFVASLAFGQTATLTPYTIVVHTGYKYTVQHGRVVMKVEYHESQTSVCKDGDKDFLNCLVTGLHLHTRYGVYPHDADLSQVPEVGLRINQCVLSTPDKEGAPVIAIQPTPEPCMMQNGNTLSYAPSPNGPTAFAYVNFEIISEKEEGKR